MCRASNWGADTEVGWVLITVDPHCSIHSHMESTYPVAMDS